MKRDNWILAYCIVRAFVLLPFYLFFLPIIVESDAAKAAKVTRR